MSGGAGGRGTPGAAGWMYRLAVETLVGLHLEADRLRVAPRVPAAWGSYKIHYRYRETFYHITVKRVGKRSGRRASGRRPWDLRRATTAGAEKVTRIVMDGVELERVRRFPGDHSRWWMTAEITTSRWSSAGRAEGRGRSGDLAAEDSGDGAQIGLEQFRAQMVVAGLHVYPDPHALAVDLHPGSRHEGKLRPLRKRQPR